MGMIATREYWRTGVSLGGSMVLLALFLVGQSLPEVGICLSCVIGGLAAGALLAWGMRYWPFMLPVLMVHHLVHEQAFQAAFWHASVDLLSVLLAAYLFSDLAHRRHLRLADALRLLLMSGAVVGMLSALADLLLFPPPEGRLWSDTLAWFLANWSAEVLGYVIGVPLFLSWRNNGRQLWRDRALELALAALAAMSGAWFLYGVHPTGADGWQFVFFPLIIWVALRLGQGGVSLIMLAIAFMLGKALELVPGEAALSTQLLLLNLSATGLLLAASVEELGSTLREAATERHNLDAILNAMPNPVFLEDAAGKLVYANQALAKLLDRQGVNLTGFPVAPVREFLGLPGVSSTPRDEAFECTVKAQTDPRTLMCNQLPLFGPDGELLGHCFVATDMTEHLAAQQQLRLSSKMFESASEGVVITDTHGKIIAVNPAFTRITGFLPEDALGKLCTAFRQIEKNTSWGLEVALSLRRHGRWQGEIPGWRKNGETYPAWGSISNVYDECGRITHRVAVFSDFSARKEAESRLQFLAQRDPLTQLFNRASLLERLQQVCVAERRIAVLFIDLDRFKTVNDTLGHAVGDELLRAIAQRLRHSLKERDFLARFGGDEFMVVLEDAPSDSGLATIARRIIEEMARPCVIREHELLVTCSIGIGRFPADAPDASGLMQAADMAMYSAKDLGKNTFAFHTAEMNAQVNERSRLEGKLRSALTQSQFVLHYQPQFELAGEEFHGVEALVRWQHPELGMVPPASFIPLAEETGAIEIIGQWVIKEACRQMRAWLDDGIDVRRVAINLSPRQFRRRHLLDIVSNALDEFGLEGERLELEITENVLMEDPQEASAVLDELREMGVRIAIDDFGHGYSSLAYLKDFPLDTLKIDRSFIAPLPEDGDMAAIVEAVVEMATKLRLTVVAEGVENATQSSYLRHIGCAVAQGYHYSRPVTAGELAGVVSQVCKSEQVHSI